MQELQKATFPLTSRGTEVKGFQPQLSFTTVTHVFYDNKLTNLGNSDAGQPVSGITLQGFFFF